MRILLALLCLTLCMSSAHAEYMQTSVSKFVGIPEHLAVIVVRYANTQKQPMKDALRQYAGTMAECRIGIDDETLDGEIFCPRVRKISLSFTLSGTYKKAARPLNGQECAPPEPIKRTRLGGTFRLLCEDKDATMNIRMAIKHYQ